MFTAFSPILSLNEPVSLAYESQLVRRPRQVMSLIIRAAATPVLAGLVTGLAGAFALTGLLQSLLFNVSPRDPLTFAVIPLILATIALLSAYLPARRASRLDPMASLRAE